MNRGATELLIRDEGEFTRRINAIPVKSPEDSQGQRRKRCVGSRDARQPARGHHSVRRSDQIPRCKRGMKR